MKMKKVVDEVASINTKTNGIQMLLNSGKNFCKSAQQKYLKSIGSMKSKVRSYLKSLEDKQKLNNSIEELNNNQTMLQERLRKEAEEKEKKDKDE